MAPGGAEQLQRLTRPQASLGLDSAVPRVGEPSTGSQAHDQLLLGGDPDRRLRPGQKTLPGTYNRQGHAVRETAQAPSRAEPARPRTLSLDEQRVIQKLQARDAEVRAHESAHKAAGGSLAGAASYTYQQGPDGRNYAIGGEVSIRMPGSGSPETLARNAQQVRRAAMAPANPSGSDAAIAAMATRAEQQARADIRSAQVEEAAQVADGRGAGSSATTPASADATEAASTAPVALGMSIPEGRSPEVDAIAGRTFVARTDAEPLPPPRPRPPEPPPEPKAKEPPPPPKEPPPEDG